MLLKQPTRAIQQQDPVVVSILRFEYPVRRSSQNSVRPYYGGSSINDAGRIPASFFFTATGKL
jgi:hypothetical protein